MKFNVILKNLREDNDFNQSEIAGELEVSRSVISHLESGRNEPDLKSLIKLAEIFNVSIDFLIKGENYNNDKNGNKLFYKSNKHKRLHEIIDLLDQDSLDKAEWFLNSLVDMQKNKEDTKIKKA